MYMKVLPRTALLNIDETKDLFVKSESQARLRKHLGQNKSHHLHFSILSSFSMFSELKHSFNSRDSCSLSASLLLLVRIDNLFYLSSKNWNDVLSHIPNNKIVHTHIVMN